MEKAGYPQIKIDSAANVGMTDQSTYHTYTTGTLTEGAHTIIVYARDPKGNTRTATRSFIVDITEPEIFKQIVKDIIEKYNKVDILVNNAGINIVSDADIISDEEFLQIQEINVHGPFLLAQAF